MIESICPTCGHHFYRSREHRHGKFCSADCVTGSEPRAVASSPRPMTVTTTARHLTRVMPNANIRDGRE